MSNYWFYLHCMHVLLMCTALCDTILLLEACFHQVLLLMLIVITKLLEHNHLQYQNNSQKAFKMYNFPPA